MAPKQQKSKKAIREKSAQMMSDATFGLKNKNKSSKVQKYVKQVETAVKHSDGSAARAANAEMKKATKISKAAQEEELRKLLGEGLMGAAEGPGKKADALKARAEALGLTEISERNAELLAEFSSDSSEEEVERKEKRTTIFLDSDSENDETGGERIYREKTIEDLIDEQRAKLQSAGEAGTPVTEESFAKWRKGKLEQKEREAEERVRAEQTKKKGGKGLSVLSGKELFKYDATLFRDDDAAIDKAAEMELSDQRKLSEEQEAVLEKEASEKAQKEQDRLMEVARVEREARRLKDEARVHEALKKLRIMLVGGVSVNEVVFEEDEVEDLALFSDDSSSDEEESDDDEADAEAMEEEG